MFLSGQDINGVGVSTNMLTGVMTAGAILERNTLVDLWELHDKIGGRKRNEKIEL